MPVSDWQFWIVTLAAVYGLWRVIKIFLPRKDKQAGCTHCASGAAASRKKRGAKVSLTVNNNQV